MAPNVQEGHRPWSPFILPTQSSSSESDSEDEESVVESSGVVHFTPHRPIESTTTTTATTSAVTRVSSSIASTPHSLYTFSSVDSDLTEVSPVPFAAPPLTMRTRSNSKEEKENSRPKTRAVTTRNERPSTPPPPPKRSRKEPIRNPYSQDEVTKDNRKPPPPNATKTVTTTTTETSKETDVATTTDVVPSVTNVVAPVNNTIIIQNMLQALPSFPATQQSLEVPNVEDDKKRWVKEWSSATLKDILGKDIDVTRIEGVTTGNKPYQYQKKKSFNRFCESMRKHKLFATLAEEVGHDGPNIRIRLFDVVGGLPTPDKSKLLNNICINYAVNMKMKLTQKLIDKIKEDGEIDVDTLETIDPVFNPEVAKKYPQLAKRMYQPGTVTTSLKHVFAVLHSNGVMINQRDFNNFPGSYLLYWTLAWEYAAAIRSDFGTRPNRAQVEMDGDKKIREAMNAGKLDITNNYHHCLMYILYMMAYSYGLRGTKEVSKRDDEDCEIRQRREAVSFTAYRY